MATSFDFANLGGLLFGGGMEEDPLSKLLKAQAPNLQAQAGRQGALQAAAALLQAGAPSRMPTTLGSALGAALQAGQAGYQGAQQQGLQRMMSNLQIQKLIQEAADKKTIRDIITKAMPTAGAQPDQAQIAQAVLQAAPRQVQNQVPTAGGETIGVTTPNLGPTQFNANLLNQINLAQQVAPKAQTQQGFSIGPSDIQKIAAINPELAAKYATIYNQMSPDLKVSPNGVVYDARDVTNLGKTFPNVANVNGVLVDLNDPLNIGRVVPKLPEGVSLNQKGQAVAIPGIASAVGAITGATETAKQQAQAPFQVVTLPTQAGGSVIMSGAQFARQFNTPGIGPTQPTPQAQPQTQPQAQPLTMQQAPGQAPMQQPAPFIQPPSGIGGQTTEGKSTAEEFTRFFYKDILSPAKAASDAARGEKAALQSGLAIMSRTPTDKINMSDTVKSLSGYAKAAGLLSAEGEKRVTNIAALNSLLQDAVFNKLLPQKGPQTEGDATRALQVYNGLGDAKAMEFLFRFAVAKGNMSEEYYRFMSNWNASNKPKNQAENAWLDGPGGRSVIKDPVMKPFWPLLTQVKELNGKKYRIFPDGSVEELGN
jgi:hypothetical protein